MSQPPLTRCMVQPCRSACSCLTQPTQPSGCIGLVGQQQQQVDEQLRVAHMSLMAARLPGSRLDAEPSGGGNGTAGGSGLFGSRSSRHWISIMDACMSLTAVYMLVYAVSCCPSMPCS